LSPTKSKHMYKATAVNIDWLEFTGICEVHYFLSLPHISVIEEQEEVKNRFFKRVLECQYLHDNGDKTFFTLCCEPRMLQKYSPLYCSIRVHNESLYPFNVEFLNYIFANQTYSPITQRRFNLGTITRLDLAVDFTAEINYPHLFTWLQTRKPSRQNLAILNGETSKLKEDSLSAYTGKSHTLYVGSRSSFSFLRLYEKGKTLDVTKSYIAQSWVEQELINGSESDYENIQRLEIQLKSDYLNAFVQQKNLSISEVNANTDANLPEFCLIQCLSYPSLEELFYTGVLRMFNQYFENEEKISPTRVLSLLGFQSIGQKNFEPVKIKRYKSQSKITYVRTLVFSFALSWHSREQLYPFKSDKEFTLEEREELFEKRIAYHLRHFQFVADFNNGMKDLFNLEKYSREIYSYYSNKTKELKLKCCDYQRFKKFFIQFTEIGETLDNF